MEQNKKPNNPPAFPHQFESIYGLEKWSESRGMTLRDYFAAKFMQANADNDEYKMEALAKHSYQMADAMLMARENQNPKEEDEN